MDGRRENEPPGTVTDDARVEVRRDGRVVARADVSAPVEPHGTAKVAVRSHHGEPVPGARRDLVDQVLDHPGVRSSDDLHVVLPLGDSESITRLQERTTGLQARAAGASSVVEAEVVPPGDEA